VTVKQALTVLWIW